VRELYQADMEPIYAARRLEVQRRKEAAAAAASAATEKLDP
jgi:hypothetical protein